MVGLIYKKQDVMSDLLTMLFIGKLMQRGIVKIIFASSLPAALSGLALVATPLLQTLSMKYYLSKDYYERRNTSRVPTKMDRKGFCHVYMKNKNIIK
jgi:hypothetical protein